MGDYPFVVSSQTAINAAGITLSFDKPTDLRVGDILVAALRSQSSVSTQDWTCSGFSRIGPPFLSANASQRVTGFYRYEVTDVSSVPSTITFSVNGTNQRASGVLFVVRGGGQAALVDSFYVHNIGPVGSYNTTRPKTLNLFMAANEVVSPNATEPTTTPAGFTQVNLATTSTNTTISRTVVYVGSKQQADAGATGASSVGWASSAGVVSFGISLYDPTPSPVAQDSSGNSLSVSIYDGSSTETAISTIQALPTTSYTVTQMDADIAANKTVYWAHRGGSSDWPQMTMRAYTNAIWWGTKVLEVSVRQASDGVFMMIHDNTTDAVTATSYTVSTTPSSTLLGIPVDTPTTGGVLGRLEDILAAYPDFVIIADRKAQGNMTSFLNLLKTVPDWQNHVIVKFDGQWDKATGSAAKDQGFKTAAYLYDTNYSAHMTSILSYTDYLGLNYDASSSIWTEFVATGKVLWGHVCTTVANANAAVAGGAKIIQCGSVKTIVPKINAV